MALISYRQFRAIVFLFSASIAPLIPARADESELTILIPQQPSMLSGKPGRLLSGRDGYLYGMTDLGEFFRLRDDGSGTTIIRRFDPANILPRGFLFRGKDGYFYGRASSSSKNVIYRMDTQGRYREIYQFPDGQLNRDSRLSLIEGADDVFYGVLSPKRTLFRLNKDGTGFKVVRQFTVKEGDAPSLNLVYGSNGKLYGTGGPGPNGTGFVYSINPDGSDYRILTAFRSRPKYDKLELESPSDLLEGPDGILYGSASYGGPHPKEMGGVFRLNKNGKDYQTVRFFSGRFQRWIPRHPYSLFLGFDGRLYGVCSQGGSHLHGMLFSLRRDGSEFTNELQPDDVQPGSHGLSVSDEIAPLVFVGQNGGGRAEGTVTYKLKIGVLPPKISTPKTVTTSEAKKRIAGTAKSRVGIQSVEYRVNAGEFRTIRGKESWSFTAEFPRGRNNVEIRVRDSRGQESLKSVSVVRK